MAKEYAKKFYASGVWHKCRDGYIRYRQSVDGGMCEVCQDQPGYIVHHKQAIRPSNINDTAVTLSWANLQYVCKSCHDKLHEYGGRYQPQRKVIFDTRGNPIAPPEFQNDF